MASVPVIVKHQGKKYEVELDTSSSPEDFKVLMYSLTEVEPERQKIILAGKQLKDDTDLSKVKLKPGSLVTMMGTPSGEGAPKLEQPKDKIRFVEDMTEREIAKKGGGPPAGLENLGNTCYLNSTLQVLRSVPELRTTLPQYTPSLNSASGPSPAHAIFNSRLDLTASLRDLYSKMSETSEGFPPIMFLNALRAAFPQFAEKSEKDPHMYAQQDAEEAWSQIIGQLRQKLKIKAEDHQTPDEPANGASSTAQKAADLSFIDEYMAGRMDSVLECDESEAVEGGEKPTRSQESFLKLDCHISGSTNHLRDGLVEGLEEKLEKKSAILNRDAIYTKKSRVSRLPKYLTVHFIRFYFKPSTQKKAKIMRKVTFPQELDAVEFCTDALQKQLIPVRDAIRDLRKEEQDDERARKRQKIAQRHADDVKAYEAAQASSSSSATTVDAKDENTKPERTEQQLKIEAEIAERKRKLGKPVPSSMSRPDPKAALKLKSDAQIAADRLESIRKSRASLLSLIDPELLADKGSNPTGLYELRAVITHQGASADSGHYTSYVKKERQKQWDPVRGVMGEEEVEDGMWWWFNDEKVSEVKQEVVEALAGGGESHSALILLYRGLPLPEGEKAGVEGGKAAEKEKEKEKEDGSTSKKAKVEETDDTEMS